MNAPPTDTTSRILDGHEPGNGPLPEMTDMCQEIRDVRTTSQRQLWVLIGAVIVTMVGGMITVVFFP
jgi:hypothetical protein